MAEGRPHLLVVPAFLGGHGGFENHVLATARTAAEAGYRVSVITPRPIPPDGDLGPRLAEWAEVDDVERRWRARLGARVTRAAAAVKATLADRRVPGAERRATLALDRARPYVDGFWQHDGRSLVAGADLVHAFGKPKPFVTGAIDAAADAGVPVVYTEIAQVTADYAARPDLRGFARVADRCDAVTVMAEGQGEDVRRHFGYQGPVIVIEQWADGLERELLALDPPSRRAVEGRPVVVGSLCRLSPEKGLDTLLAAFARVAERRPDVVLSVAGTGELAPVLRAQAAALGIADQVEFLGFVEDRVGFYRSVDLFTVCSIEEGGPITGVEAMAAARPVVSTGCGAMPDRIRDGHEGLRFEPGDVTALAAAIGRLVDDAESRVTLGTAARRRYLQRNTEAANRDRLVGLWAELRQVPHDAPATAGTGA